MTDLSILSFGKWRGLTFRYTSDTYPKYCDWIVSHDDKNYCEGFTKFKGWVIQDRSVAVKRSNLEKRAQEKRTLIRRNCEELSDILEKLENLSLE
jgi:hypothetical protein